MKTFAFALLGASVAAFGTTGHFNNNYAHKGQGDHAHEDHVYGYDSVPQDLDLDATANGTLATAIITAMDLANEDRKDYLSKTKLKRVRRLEEIHLDNLKKINAPFTYQLRLVTEEEDDILQARNNAIRDANDAFDDLEYRLEDLKDDIFEGLDREELRITQALDRALIDRKNPAQVFLALRIDWTQKIVINPVAITGPPAAAYTAATTDFSMYDGLFDDFHYDIGHGKGTGEGTVDLGGVRDGFSSRADPRARGPVGDYETDQGAQTWAWEQPGSRRRY